MSRLLKYCEEKLAEAKENKERAIRYLGVVERAIEIGEPVGPMQYIHTKQDTEKAKLYIEKWDYEIQIWEAEKKLLKG